ncbi:MAG: TonB-dependent receptor [Bacteroidia bacterium]|nr:TonB-dependent receptor [Bacteroidia bacterium]MBT8269589.1 TonB-dependent receptor [Bacteroidia bacterium]
MRFSQIHRSISLFVFFAILSANVFSQRVVVKDKSTYEPIPGVVVFNQDKSKNAITDFNGFVSLYEFDSSDILTFKHIGFFEFTAIKDNVPVFINLRPKELSLDEVVISASKFEQSRKEVPKSIISVKAEDILFNAPQTSADLLINSGKVFVQKSQLGGGSPMIRGFSTNRLLLSVDDVRMNNAIFRGGNLQNVISIDPFNVQNTEVILGAGSVIYGSDAIGGVMNFYTKRPFRSENDSLLLKANGNLRYSSASNEIAAHADVNFGLKKWAFLSSISYTDFDDLKMGKHGPEDYLRPEYVESNNGTDIIVPNDDPRIQRFTGYNQINLMQKINYRGADDLNYNLGLHYSTTSDFPRYDRLIQYRDGELRSAEWNYGPQKWFLANFQISRFESRSNLYDKIKFTLAYQNFKESRIDRNLNSESRRTREEQVDALSVNFDLEKDITESTTLAYGAEYIYNLVGSKAEQRNILDGSRESIVTRYPDGSSWKSAAAYFNFKYRPNKKLTFQSGLRYNYIGIRADLGDNNEFLNLPFNNANLETGALTGTAGVSWSPNDKINWKLNGTTAFRAPNIDDVGKVFDSAPGSVVIPNSDLKPEYAYGAELGLTLNFENNVVLDFATYYTYLDDALVRRDFSINGQSEIIYDGELSRIQAIQNASKAWIYGFEAGLTISFSEQLKLRSQYSIVGGNEEDVDGVEVPVRHVAPAFGNTHLIWENDKLKFDAFLIYNNELSFDQLSPTEVDKAYLYATDENGNPYSPSWYTFNLRSSYQFTDQTVLVLSLENITNQRYRPYSSGIAAAGRNLIVSLRYSL